MHDFFYPCALGPKALLLSVVAPSLAFAGPSCPLPDTVDSLTTSVALTRSLKSGKTLLALRDVNEAPGIKRVLTLQLINADNRFEPGTYTVASDGSIPGLCAHAACVELSVEMSGTTVAVVAREGQLTLESTAGRLTGRFEGVTFKPGGVLEPLPCDAVEYTVGFDLPIQSKADAPSPPPTKEPTMNDSLPGPSGSRGPPPVVRPVELNGTRFEQALSGLPLDATDVSGWMRATQIASGEQVWLQQVYTNPVTDPDQPAGGRSIVYMRRLEVDGKGLLVEDLRGRRFHVDPRDGSSRPAR